MTPACTGLDPADVYCWASHWPWDQGHALALAIIGVLLWITWWRIT